MLGYDLWTLLLGLGAGLACGFLNTAASSGSASGLDSASTSGSGSAVSAVGAGSSGASMSHREPPSGISVPGAAEGFVSVASARGSSSSGSALALSGSASAREGFSGSSSASMSKRDPPSEIPDGVYQLTQIVERHFVTLVLEEVETHCGRAAIK